MPISRKYLTTIFYVQKIKVLMMMKSKIIKDKIGNIDKIEVWNILDKYNVINK
jgi:hypothetical protein